VERKLSYVQANDQTLKSLKAKMENNIMNFRLERVSLKMLKFNDGNEQRKNITFIKGEVLDM
jgi:hypothetical protein